MTVSACIIAKNEAHNIRPCIDSVRSAVDEVVVVDTGSDDGTRDLARAAGAIVYEYPGSRIDFAAWRNAAIARSRSDYVLMMDADHRWPEETKMNLLRALETRPAMVATFLFAAQSGSNYEEVIAAAVRGGGHSARAYAAAFRRDLGPYFVSRIHETPVIWSAERDISDAAGISPGVVDYSVNRDSRLQRYRRTLVEQLTEIDAVKMRERRAIDDVRRPTLGSELWRADALELYTLGLLCAFAAPDVGVVEPYANRALSMLRHWSSEDVNRLPRVAAELASRHATVVAAILLLRRKEDTVTALALADSHERRFAVCSDTRLIVGQAKQIEALRAYVDSIRLSQRPCEPAPMCQASGSLYRDAVELALGEAGAEKLARSTNKEKA